jgi:hypothetical protein
VPELRLPTGPSPELGEPPGTGLPKE